MQLQQQEIETLAVILISALTHSINGKLIAAYLNLIRHNHQDIAPGLISLKYPDASIELPANFASNIQTHLLSFLLTFLM